MGYIKVLFKAIKLISRGENLNAKNFLSGLLLIIISVISILLCTNEMVDTSLFLSLLTSILMIFWAKSSNGDYTNITVFFIAFNMLYGVSGPINAEWGEGLHPLFSRPYQTSEFLISYNMANIGLVIGITVFNLISKRSSFQEPFNSKVSLILQNCRKKLFKIACFLAFIASISEVINLIRIGGISVLFSGKALYQSLSSSLTLTLPSSDFMIIAFSFFGLFLGVAYKNKDYSKGTISSIIKFSLVSLPYILLNTILGQRGILLTLFIGILIGVTYYNPIKKIKPKLVIVVLVFYVFLSFLFANRSNMYLLKDNFSAFMETAFKKNRIVEALNPGGNEFGAAFGNYSEFYLKNNNDFDVKLGETYVKGLVMPIPSFLYPGEKPQQITYQFRDQYFASEASRGRIAGTAFSSILEAYINFKQFGVLMIYLLIGLFLQYFDKKFRYKSLLSSIIYISLISTTVIFHRSAFGDVFSIFVLRIGIIFVAFLTIGINLLKVQSQQNEWKAEQFRLRNDNYEKN